MEIYLLDNNPQMVDAWKKYFGEEPNVHCQLCDFCTFMDYHSAEIDCVVSPANSYGLMDGGYDLAVTAWFGKELPLAVQRYIVENYRGEQPVGTSFYIETPVPGIGLIHTPSMRKPSLIKDKLIVYQCMRTTLMEAIKHGVKSIVIPAFGGLTGHVDLLKIASLMYDGYKQIMNPPSTLDWDYADRFIKYEF